MDKLIGGGFKSYKIAANGSVTALLVEMHDGDVCLSCDGWINTDQVRMLIRLLRFSLTLDQSVSLENLVSSCDSIK
jgi:hypothetical protein